MNFRLPICKFLLGCFAIASFVRAAEINLPDHHLSMTLPEGWSEISKKPAGIIFRAQNTAGKLQLLIVHKKIDEKVSVKDSDFQKGVKDGARDQGFPNVIRSELTKINGADAFLFEAARADRSSSFLQISWFQNQDLYALNFASLSKPFKEIPSIAEIIASVKKTP
jgi:hypothetical protein